MMSSILSSGTHPTIIDTVPNEIWAQILEHAHSNESLVIEVYQSSLSKVCSNWREIALSTPKLWTYVNLQVDKTSHCPNAKLINLWLERSKNEPLSVEITVWDYDLEWQPELHDCLVRLFSHNMSRWKTAKLCINYSYMPDLRSWTILLSSIRGAAPILEFIHVEVDVEQINESPEELLPSRLWMDAPVLRTFVVNVKNYLDLNLEGYSYFPSWAIQNRIPYGQITHLLLQAVDRVDIITWKDIYVIFTSSPNLVSCFLRGVEGPGIPHVTGPVVLKHLQHLYLEASGNYRSGMLTRQLELGLTAPALLTLSLANDNSWNQESYFQFVTRSQCVLDELHFINSRTRASNFIECIRLSPSLKLVHMSDMADAEQQQIGRSMTEMEWDAATATEKFTLVPSLQIFSVGYSGISASESMLEMLKKRLRPPNGSTKMLSTLMVPSMDEITADLVLQALCEEPWGLGVSLNVDVGTMWKLYGGGY